MKMHTPKKYVGGMLAAMLMLAGAAVQAAPQQVEIHDATGKLQFTLRESEAGDTLRLIAANGGREAVIDCKDHMVPGSEAQQGPFSVAVEIRACGATVADATRVVLKGEAGSELLAVFAGKPEIRLRWSDAQTLDISHASVAPEYIYLQQARTLAGHAIVYQPTGAVVVPVEQKAMDLSNLNFGFTGTAAQMPREGLLRWAGWAQQRSGLYRKEWGQWAAAAPYGDDPAGQQAILAGISFAQKKMQESKQ